MHITIAREDLLTELGLMRAIVQRKGTIPILSHVLATANGDGLALAATDLDVALTSHCAAQIVQPGTMAWPAVKLYEILKALADDATVTLTGDARSVTLRADYFDAKLQTLPAEDFPALPHAEDATWIELPQGALRNLLAHTHFAATDEDTRYFLNGAKFEIEPTEMRMVATDGHRLARAQAPYQSPMTESLGWLLPKKTMTKLLRLLNDTRDEPVHYWYGEHHVFIEIDGRTLISRLIDATFPDYERVIPKENDKTLTVDRQALLETISRVMVMANERSRTIALAIAGQQMQVRSSNAESGEASDHLAVAYDGPDVSISFHAPYVLDFLRAVESEQICMLLKDAVGQAVFTQAGDAQSEYLYVLMPMRT